MCVCVWDLWREPHELSYIHSYRSPFLFFWVCVCVCVCPLYSQCISGHMCSDPDPTSCSIYRAGSRGWGGGKERHLKTREKMTNEDYPWVKTAQLRLAAFKFMNGCFQSEWGRTCSQPSLCGFRALHTSLQKHHCSFSAYLSWLFSSMQEEADCKLTVSCLGAFVWGPCCLFQWMGLISGVCDSKRFPFVYLYWRGVAGRSSVRFGQLRDHLSQCTLFSYNLCIWSHLYVRGKR